MKTRRRGDIFILSIFAVLEMTCGNILNTYFNIKDNVAIRESSSTRDFKVKSLFGCVALCARNSECCASSFSPEFICRLEMSSDCKFFTSVHHGSAISMYGEILQDICMEYDLLKAVANFTNAQMLCNNFGMELVVIKDTDTNDKITSYLSAHSVSKDMWVGMSWDGSVQKFRWTDNNAEVVESVPWGIDEPNCMTPYPGECLTGGPNQNCVRLTPSGVLKTMYCNNEYLPFCQGNILC